MTIEELLRPRYKVIADYPMSMHRPGDILPVIGTAAYTKGRIEFMNKYPHLFKKLEWWEERKPEDMPEYIKFTNSGRVYKISKWDKDIGGWHMNNVIDGKNITNGFASIEWHFQKEKCVPATREEYEAYIKTTA